MAYKNEYLINNITHILRKFETYELADIEQAQLMNRVDSKFLMCCQDIPPLLNKLVPLSKLLSINERGFCEYHNTYFDDPGYGFYHQHHRGKYNRHKVRIRRYGEQKHGFLEVKFKNNKKRTIKNRMVISAPQIQQNCLADDFLKQHNVFNGNSLVPVQHCNYSRIGLSHEPTAQRMTIDFNLRFYNHQSQRKIDIPDLAIVELKQDVFNRNTDLFKLIKSFRAKPEPCSKYCLGLVLDSTLKTKQNLFKPTILRVHELSGVIVNE